MKYGTSVSAATKRSPPNDGVAPWAVRGVRASNAIVTEPPSPRQVHVGGGSERLQLIFPPTSSQRAGPFACWRLVPVTARIFMPGPGNHVNRLMNPFEFVFVISRL